MGPITLKARVRNKSTRKTGTITKSNYTSKEQFWKVLEKHNYIVINISTTRDLAAQEYGFETFTAMKKHDKHFRETTGRESAFTKIIDDISRLPLL